MSKDYESFDNMEKRSSGRDDFPSMTTDLVRRVNWKVALLLFVIGVLIFSDVFIDLFLVSMKDTVEGDCPTSKGTVIQLTCLVLSYVIIDLLVQGEFI
jgi:hypothetical protein